MIKVFGRSRICRIFLDKSIDVEQHGQICGTGRRSLSNGLEVVSVSGQYSAHESQELLTDSCFESFSVSGFGVKNETSAIISF